MSVISEKVRTALYTKCNVSGLVDTANAAKLYGIFEGRATVAIPSGRSYGIFNRQAPGPILYAFNQTPVLESDLWQLRVYAESVSAAEGLLNTWVTTLGTSLTLTGNTVVWCGKEMDLPNTDQQLSDRYVFGRGSLIRIATE